MKVIKFLFLLSIIAILGCSDDDLSNQENQDLTPSLRFNFIVDNNDIPLEYPANIANKKPLDRYENTSLKPLKIPVILSSRSIDKPVTATYSLQTDLPASAYQISTENLQFTAEQPTDTIQVKFLGRWNESQKLKFSITSVSDPSIQIGSLNNQTGGNQFEINLGELITTYQFDINRIELKGTMDEAKNFKVEFPYGYLEEEINDSEIFRFLNGFEYVLQRSEINDDSINYEIILKEILNDDVASQSTISLKENDNYTISGKSNIIIDKPIHIDRNTNTNPASHFYDLSNQYYLVRGENWLDHNNNGECSWRSWTAFGVPVAVDANDENAVLNDYDNNYYNAYKIGFVSPIAGKTTNPFNLKRWFDYESSEEADSPGLNIKTAIEFYPEDGTSLTNGIVSVIPQFLTISNKDDKRYEFAISGTGTYRQIEETLWEIKLSLKVTNEELYEGTVTSEYYIYSERGYEDPEIIPGNQCIEEILL
ncbi:hypothetical protein [Mesonia aestuariivivens]|uniref:DUF1735 domain-containing protein n=1 Tax=Mesonia aestuariivivens TaxID=2796128 RepID=A0ABS6VYC2_9FLAO|nr:hypothetical protein [Mesonia aestuariivivens]MBW2960585.1 hypothetical protein [Mesonia aestuariivivens]